MINYVKGDATAPFGVGPRIICHIVNDLGLWGSGFVLAISHRWTKPEQEYKAWARSNNQWFGLGEVQYVDVLHDITVANMVGQRGVRNEYNAKPLHLPSLQECLIRVSDVAWVRGATVHMPRIGCGLAGGKWEEVEPLIINARFDKDVYVYDFE